jgi:hypothetical protein
MALASMPPARAVMGKTFLSRQSVSRLPDKRGQKALIDSLLWAVRQGRWSATAPLIPSVPGALPAKAKFLVKFTISFIR